MKQVRVVYATDRQDSIFGPYQTREDALDMASKASTYGGVEDVIIEPYDGEDK